MAFIGLILCVLVCYDVVVEAIGHSGAFSSFMASMPSRFDGKACLYIGVLTGAGALTLWGGWLSNRLRAYAVLGASLFLAAFAACCAACLEEGTLPANATAFALLGVGFVLAKFYALHRLWRVRSFTVLVWCVSAAQVVKTILVAAVLEVGRPAQLAVIAVVAILGTAGLLLLALLVDSRREPFPADIEAFMDSGESKSQLAGRACFAVVLLATIQVFTPVGEYGDEFTLGVMERGLAVLAVPLLAWRILLKGYPGVLQSLRVSFYILVGGLLLIALQTSGAWMLSGWFSELLLTVLECFGHVAYWTTILLMGWSSTRNDLRIMGAFMMLFAGCSLLWLVLLGNLGDFALVVVLVLTYACSVAIPRLYPQVIVRREGALIDDDSLRAIAAVHELTERETDVFCLLAQGRSRTFIMDELCLSDGTVKNHITRIYRKLGVSSKQAMITAIRDGSL